MEFALVLPALLLITVTLVELTSLARLRLEVTAAAREGARVAAVRPEPADAVSAVKAALPDEVARRTRVVVRRPHVVGRSATVEVVVSHRVLSPLLGGIRVAIRGRAAMAVER